MQCTGTAPVAVAKAAVNRDVDGVHRGRDEGVYTAMQRFHHLFAATALYISAPIGQLNTICW